MIVDYVEGIKKKLEEGDTEERRRAVRILEVLCDEDGKDCLLKALDDEDYKVRGIAARALGEIGGEEVTEEILKLLGDEKYFVRGSAAEALGEIGDDKAVDDLILTVIKGDVGWVQQKSIEALEEIGETEELKRFKEWLRQ